eukprot:TRINITY_DN27821_c1_g1_i1.p1 TRINITY_DN27821_c1_g1~~TRINITY_DN27821_c1_g1_i1.p1  ORF type:complete len:143 (+),score=7.66 TRINITY_DN27821_c1_g1_i1:49-477(+)
MVKNKKWEVPDFLRENQVDSIYKFLASVDWSERWLQYIIVFHVTLCILIILTRKFLKTQIVVFTVLLCSVLSAEKLNELLAQNYAVFARQQYFDSNGMFISLIWSMPVLINAIIILINWFLYSGNLLVKVKQKELLEKSKKE